jgi:hypothetical protein
MPSLPIMNYTYHASLTGGADYFKKMYQFLLAQGWTINEFRDANSLWSGTYPYEWSAGTESFLDVQPPAACHVGIQHYRMNLRHYNINTTTDGIYQTAVEPKYLGGDYKPSIVLTRVGTVATATFVNDHGLVAGNQCYVTGMTITGNDIYYRPGASPAGIVTVVTTPTTKSFTYTMGGTPTNSPALGSPTCSMGILHPCIQFGTTGHVWGPGTANDCECFTLPKNSFTGCWFFENGYSFWSVVQPTVGTCFLWGFGTPNLTSEYYAITDIQQVHAPCWAKSDWTNLSVADSGSNQNQWASGETYPFQMTYSSPGPYVRADGVAPTTYNVYYNLCIGRHTNSPAGYTYFDSMNTSVLLNTFNNIRPGIVPDVYLKRVGSGQWECVGTLPLAKIYSAGLNVGDHLFYGSEEYISFPNLSTAASLYGNLIRIA